MISSVSENIYEKNVTAAYIANMLKLKHTIAKATINALNIFDLLFFIFY